MDAWVGGGVGGQVERQTPEILLSLSHLSLSPSSETQGGFKGP